MVYSGLPGILGERLFQYFDQDDNGFLDKAEFVKGFFRLFSSNIDTSLKFAFQFYDFDRDGFITQEDLRLVMSYVPICSSTAQNEEAREGFFTSAQFAKAEFRDRIETQQQIEELIKEVFAGAEKL